jgi:hypothetical protein
LVAVPTPFDDELAEANEKVATRVGLVTATASAPLKALPAPARQTAGFATLVDSNL